MQNNNNNICVYGTYRKNQINYKSAIRNYGTGNVLYLRTLVLKGYKMYDLLYYPTIEYTGDPRDRIVVDLLRVCDAMYKMLVKAQDNSEFFEDTICIEEKFYSIFINPFISEADRSIEVQTGDWIFCNSNSEIY